MWQTLSDSAANDYQMLPQLYYYCTYKALYTWYCTVLAMHLSSPSPFVEEPHNDAGERR